MSTVDIDKAYKLGIDDFKYGLYGVIAVLRGSEMLADYVNADDLGRHMELLAESLSKDGIGSDHEIK